jgi:hypothetical protein
VRHHSSISTAQASRIAIAGAQAFITGGRPASTVALKKKLCSAVYSSPAAVCANGAR